MARFPRLRSAPLFALATSFTTPALAAGVCDNYGPISPDLRVNASSGFDQIWGRVARGQAGFTFTWSAGQDVWMRRYDLALDPLGSDVQVNGTLTFDIQDEPEVAYSGFDTTLVAWSDRAAHDGQLMGIFGRVYAANGAPLGPEFQINQAGAASQWRPLIAPMPAGFVVAFSGDWDGDSFFRILDQNGVPQGGDVRVNDWEIDAQVDPAPAVNRFGTIFIAFVDFSGHGSVGSGLNLYGRTFSSTGVPQQPQEFAITTTTGNGDQREPRVGADAFGRFVVVWEDQTHDGSGYGIFARRYDASIAPLGPEFQVNSTTSGNQRSATVAVQRDGGFLVSWLDSSAGAARIRARRFDPNAAPIGDDFVVNETPAANVERPSLAQSTFGDDLVVAYAGPGDASDVYMRRFALATGPIAFGAPKPASHGCMPTISSSGTPSATDPTPFLVQASDVLNQVTGGLYYSFGSAYTPFLGGTLYLAMPSYRTTNFFSAGNPLPYDCSGTFSYDFNALIQSGANASLTVGKTVSAQYIFRDVQDPTFYGRGMTNGLRFTICP